MRRVARLRWCGEFISDVLQVFTERAHDLMVAIASPMLSAKAAPPGVIRRVCGRAGPDVRQACKLVNGAPSPIESVVAPLFLTGSPAEAA